MSEHLYLTEKEYFQFRTSKKDLPASSILLLAHELGLDPENLSYGRLDYQAFQKHYSGEYAYLPERYSRAAFSKRLTSFPILEFSDLHFGQNFTDLLLKKLQVNRIIFRDPNESINILFLTDACEFFVKMGHPQSILFQMGAQFSTTHQNTEVGKRLKQCKTIKEAYETYIHPLTELLERNWSYKLLTLNNTSCLLEAEENDEVLQALHLNHLGSQYTCAVKTGITSTIPAFLNLPLGSSLETHCVHRGDSSCRYEVNFEYAYAMQKKKQKFINPPLQP
jgi:hypothetical protein